MVSMKSLWSSVRLSSGGGVRLVVQLDVELHAAHARKVVLARVEEHALEQLRGGVHRGRIAGAQLAVDFEQRFVLLPDAVLLKRHGNDVADFVEFREEDVEGGDVGFDQLADDGGRDLMVGLDQHLAGFHVDDVGGDVAAFEIVGGDFHLLDFGLLQVLVNASGDLAALGDDGFPALE